VKSQNRNDPKSEKHSLDLLKRVIPNFQSIFSKTRTHLDIFLKKDADTSTAFWLTDVFFQHIMHKLNMKHEKHPWFIRDSKPVPLGQKSGALTTELQGHPFRNIFPN
jgi:hypothetical protein